VLGSSPVTSQVLNVNRHSLACGDKDRNAVIGVNRKWLTDDQTERLTRSGPVNNFNNKARKCYLLLPHVRSLDGGTHATA